MSFHTAHPAQYDIYSTVNTFNMPNHCTVSVYNAFESNDLYDSVHTLKNTYKKHKYIDTLSHGWIC